ncbi:hypothetical protein Tdes44962_MAKER05844 [Teratosphaeria destructans]|uniref:Uncharacterized protein n=1 Tax=Teratosphaeria destructans TaxID=418781 RepID=A0A9W7SIS7_9PEZI|nr:hypothetical protein Tdes44962_MAKER05844 [Teratosphaeria destructans]
MCEISRRVTFRRASWTLAAPAEARAMVHLLRGPPILTTPYHLRQMGIEEGSGRGDVAEQTTWSSEVVALPVGHLTIENR